MHYSTCPRSISLEAGPVPNDEPFAGKQNAHAQHCQGCDKEVYARATRSQAQLTLHEVFPDRQTNILNDPSYRPGSIEYPNEEQTLVGGKQGNISRPYGKLHTVKMSCGGNQLHSSLSKLTTLVLQLKFHHELPN